jgi:predicted PurR-regulated permease PerM
MENAETWRLRDVVLTIAGIVIILGAARYAQAIVVPFLLSIFLAIIASAPDAWLKRRGLSAPLASAVVLLMLVFIVLGVAMLLAASAREFSAALPAYQAGLQALTAGAVDWLAARGVDLGEAGLFQVLDPGAAMGFVNGLVGGLRQVLSNAFLIMFTVLFMLLEASSFPTKLQRMRPDGGSTHASRLAEVVESTKSYIAVKALTSLATSVLVWAGLALLGVDFALLWAFLAFALNFVPNIGSIIAAVPAVLLALLQLGPLMSGAVALLYLVVNIVIGNVVEPAVMGRRIGLSTLVVFLSLVFWGWLLGPVGMILSVPLTMAVKFAALANDETYWLGVLLGPAPTPSAEPRTEGR